MGAEHPPAQIVSESVGDRLPADTVVQALFQNVLHSLPNLFFHDGRVRFVLAPIAEDVIASINLVLQKILCRSRCVASSCHGIEVVPHGNDLTPRQKQIEGRAHNLSLIRFGDNPFGRFFAIGRCRVARDNFLAVAKRRLTAAPF